MNRYENAGSAQAQLPSPPWHKVTCPECSFEYHTLYPGSLAGCPGCYAVKAGYTLSDGVEVVQSLTKDGEREVIFGSGAVSSDGTLLLEKLEKLEMTVNPPPQLPPSTGFQVRTVTTKHK